MSLSFILKFGHRTVVPIIRSLTLDKLSLGQNYHSMCKNSAKTTALLKTTPTMLDSIRGMKTKGKLNLRCKDCYFVTRQGRNYVMCKTHPRHKQQAMVKKEEHTWILTHATQSKRRPY